MGLYATKRFEPGDVICGKNPKDRIISIAQYDAELDADPSVRHHWLRLSDDSIMIPDREAMGWHLANNSCRPNARLTHDTSSLIIARRVIEPEDEITYWYGWKHSTMKCICGEEHCTGWIGLPWYPDKVYSSGSRRVADYERLIDVAVKNDNPDALTLLYSFLMVDQQWPRHSVTKLVDGVLGKETTEVHALVHAVWDRLTSTQ